jgi:hypothetical protein
MLQREALAVGVRCFEGGGVGLADDLVEPPRTGRPSIDVTARRRAAVGLQ